ncbi:MAG: hypothetical protein ACTSRE_06590 [Promethearchaeota archaeon]
MSEKPTITNADLKEGAENLAKVSEEEKAKIEDEKKKRQEELEKVKAAYEAANK